MRKLLAMVALCVALAATALGEGNVHFDEDTVAVGETVRFQVSGTEAAAYRYELLRGGQTLWTGEDTVYPSGGYRTRQAGVYTLRVYCTDPDGGERVLTGDFYVTGGEGEKQETAASASDRVQVVGGRAAFGSQGGIQRWTIVSDGVWVASTTDDFITLTGDCGGNGDTLTVTVAPSDEQGRTGHVTLRCGGGETTVELRQTADNGEETEETLFASTDVILLDGHKQVTWMDGAGEKSWTVTASGEWTWEASEDFITCRQSEGMLRVTVEDNHTGDVRCGTVALRCGAAQAYLFIWQQPAGQGAAVLSVEVDGSGGAAWQDTLRVRAVTTADAERLEVTLGEQTPVTLSQDASVLQGSERVWQTEVPLRAAGDSALLCMALDGTGRGAGKWAAVTAQPEAPGFYGDSAVQGDDGLTFTTTASVSKVEALDETGAVAAVFTTVEAEIMPYGNGAEKGRYALWSVQTDLRPSALRIGDAVLPVRAKTAAEKSIALYSQQDGWWADKAYKNSDLQRSGCAIFTLSHALQLLGFEGENTLPENLAVTYAACLYEGGTVNDALIGRAARDFGFKTRYELYKNKAEILGKARNGAVFSFAIVSGHIALAAGFDESGEKCLIYDSAPSATFERIKSGSIYYQDEAGSYVEVTDPSDIPGSVYYPETGGFGGLRYWLDTSYVVRRGVRLIQPATQK